MKITNLSLARASRTFFFLRRMRQHSEMRNGMKLAIVAYCGEREGSQREKERETK